MGSADIIPGVSGGTMALILGIYERLLNAIKSVDTNALRQLITFHWKVVFERIHWKFLAALLSGIFAAILFFTKVVPLQVLMVTDPELIYGLFFGLILGSIYILYKELDEHRMLNLTFLFTGILLGYWIVTLVPTDTPDTPLFVFLTGMVAITAMIMPGISGSYILLILRKYSTILTNIGLLGTESTLDALWILVPFGLGALTGLALFSRLLSWLLNRFHAPTLLVLIGFLIGSLYVIWPYQQRTYTSFEEVVEQVPLDSETANKLNRQSLSQHQPQYLAPGDTVLQNGRKMVEVIRVKNKLIASNPYIPYLTEDSPEELSNRMLWEGITGIIAGFLLVGLLERIR